MLKFKNQTNEENYASNELMWNILNNLVPIGSIIPFGGDNITSPMFKLCDGSVLDRIKYKVLFSVIGTTYGEGDGVSTFNLPNLIGRFLEGAIEAGTIKEAGLPNITGSLMLHGSTSGTSIHSVTGSFYGDINYNKYHTNEYTNGSSQSIANAYFDASKSSAIYGKSTTVQPNSVTCKYIMRVC